jgi:hypothetical protein
VAEGRLLAPVYLLQQNQTSAEAILTAALEPDAPMQTIGQRLVWAARADLALAHSDPGTALDITERLIASASNLSAESVIPRLWKLRGEALSAFSQSQGLFPSHLRVFLDENAARFMHTIHIHIISSVDGAPSIQHASC